MPPRPGLRAEGLGAPPCVPASGQWFQGWAARACHSDRVTAMIESFCGTHSIVTCCSMVDLWFPFVHRYGLSLSPLRLLILHTAYGPSKDAPSREGKGSPLGPERVGRITCGNPEGGIESMNCRCARTTSFCTRTRARVHMPCVPSAAHRPQGSGSGVCVGVRDFVLVHFVCFPFGRPRPGTSILVLDGPPPRHHRAPHNQ